jgi:hypothetical protein
MSFFFFFLFGQHLFVQKTQSLLLATALNFSFVAHLFSLTLRLRSLPNSTNISEELCAVCVSLSLSLSPSRVSTQRKKSEKKEKNDCTADRSSAFAATELWYVVFDTVFVSVVCFLEFLTLLSVFFFGSYPFSEFLMLLLVFFLYAFAISCCFCLLYASCYYCCCCCRRRRFCCITRFRDLSSVVASNFSLFLLLFFSFCDLSKVVVVKEKKL